jgi:hypothetical protein
MMFRQRNFEYRPVTRVVTGDDTCHRRVAAAGVHPLGFAASRRAIISVTARAASPAIDGEDGLSPDPEAAGIR